MPTNYQSITTQVANTLREEIRTMAAGEKLPGERELSLHLQVSRRTVRNALEILRAERLIATHSSSATSVISPGKRKPSRRPVRVNLLLPDPLEETQPLSLLWINELSSLLTKAGHRFDVISGRKYYGRQVARLLGKLVASNPADCWVLLLSNHSLQQWFDKHRLPAVVAGSTFPDVRLPSVDTDHLALGRHAAAELLRHGHRRTALFLDQVPYAGDGETVEGFEEVLRRHPDAAAPIVLRVTRSPESVIREVRRLQTLRHPPTGYLISNCFSYLTIHGYLASLGLRIPQDVSLISFDEGPFLRHVYPAPARYLTHPRKYALALNRTIKRILEKNTGPNSTVRIIQDYIPGASLATAAAMEDDA